jgi:hypothetical protein
MDKHGVFSPDSQGTLDPVRAASRPEQRGTAGQEPVRPAGPGPSGLRQASTGELRRGWLRRFVRAARPTELSKSPSERAPGAGWVSNREPGIARLRRRAAATLRGPPAREALPLRRAKRGARPSEDPDLGRPFGPAQPQRRHYRGSRHAAGPSRESRSVVL